MIRSNLERAPRENSPPQGQAADALCGLEGAKTVPWWAWANVFSLDAAAVAIVWSLLLARVFHVNYPWAIPAILGCAVWVIYLSDHTLDGGKVWRRGGPAVTEALPSRKIFFALHPRLMACIVFVGLAGTLLAAKFCLSQPLFIAGMVIGVCVASYLGAVHLLPGTVRAVWPREAAVAFLFCCGVCLPLWVEGSSRTPELFAAALPLFLLCWLNCCLVETWEWRRQSITAFEGRPNRLARSLADHMGMATLFTALLGECLGRWLHCSPVYQVAVAASSLMLFLSSRCLPWEQPCTVGALADLALCLPGALLLCVQSLCL